MQDPNVSAHPFDTLTPDWLIQAVESQGFLCDGRILALNSYENRVYQVGIEEDQPLIAKFYRPNRWTREQILEEHEFCFQLAEHELPVVAPLRNKQQESLHQYGDFMFTLFPRQGGHAPELDNMEHIFQLGRLLGRIHLVGAIKPFQHRPIIDCSSYGHDSVQFISEYFIPASLKTSYDTLCRDLLQALDQTFADHPEVKLQRIHGDCHTGNLLWRDDAPHFVDFDDARMGPVVQDLWMLLSGNRPQQEQQLSEILEGYSEFNDFDARELHLVEVLRTLRMMHFSAWLARRWDDPAFPKAFPWFNTERYWGEHILDLRMQMAELNEGPLRVL